MIINDGEIDRDTRNNLMNPEFTHVGIACGCHTVIGEVCCFAYGKKIDDGSQAKMEPLFDVDRKDCNEATSKGLQAPASAAATAGHDSKGRPQVLPN
jgi:hypothetical protein